MAGSGRGAVRPRSTRFLRGPGAAPQSASTSHGQDDALRYARQLLVDAKEERALADQKASVLFAAVGTGAGIAVAVAVGRHWSPLSLPLWPGVLWWLGATALVGCVVLLGAAVYPRLGPRPARDGGTVSSFRELAHCDDVGAVRRAVERSLRDEFDGVSGQLLVVGRLTAVKYACIRAALWLLVASVVLLGAAAAIALAGRA
jgi:hypothetical protein